MQAMSEVKHTTYHPLSLTNEELIVMAKVQDILSKYLGKSVHKVTIMGSGVCAAADGQTFHFELTGEIK